MDQKEIKPELTDEDIQRMALAARRKVSAGDLDKVAEQLKKSGKNKGWFLDLEKHSENDIK